MPLLPRPVLGMVLLASLLAAGTAGPWRGGSDDGADTVTALSDPGAPGGVPDFTVSGLPDGWQVTVLGPGVREGGRWVVRRKTLIPPHDVDGTHVPYGICVASAESRDCPSAAAVVDRILGVRSLSVGRVRLVISRGNPGPASEGQADDALMREVRVSFLR
ncbi:hypothetical protein [Nocardioides sp.]|uniref:hypothetical protein n=1 Tax=Nocardioides sp. TaxID=35761 RepID=UPI003512063A